MKLAPALGISAGEVSALKFIWRALVYYTEAEEKAEARAEARGKEWKARVVEAREGVAAAATRFFQRSTKH